MNVIAQLGKMPRAHLKIASLASVVLVGMIDYFTGTELAVSIFYLFPISAMSWFVGRRAGYVTALFCGVVWLASQLLYDSAYSHAFIPYWNAAVRLAVFLFSATLISEIAVRKEIEKQLRRTQTDLEIQVRERTAELERLKFLEKQVTEISEREQRRIGEDLHDGLCQYLVSTAFATAVLRERLAEKKLGEANDAEKISDMIDQAITQARQLARGLYPVRLEVDGLSSALEELAESLRDGEKISCQFHCENPVFIHELMAGASLYRIAQEAAINAMKHSNGRNIFIDLCAKDDVVRLTVADDGCGFSPPQKQNGGMGLHIMQYRARMIGATLNIAPREHGGTTVVCSYLNHPGEFDHVN